MVIASGSVARALGGAVRPAGDADAILGVRPGWVASPRDAEALSALMAAATEHDLTVIPRGEGTKLDWGRPPKQVDIVVETAALTGILAHHADDLVMTVGAGTPVRVIQAVLARAGQRLAVDPGSADATVGGMLATGEAGPIRLRHGAPRDLLLGMEFVRADGTLAHSGGRVVKNVAGYDIGKLLTGSWGTLAVITAATFRLQPIPAARAWVTRAVDTPLEVHDLVAAMLAGPLEATAIEMDLPEHGNGSLSVLLEGSIDGVASRAADTVRLLGNEALADDVPPEWWGRYPFGAGDVALKLAVPVDDLHAAVYALRDAVGTTVPIRGSAGTGVCYATVPVGRAEGALEAVRTTLIARGGSCVVLSAPIGVHDTVDMWGPVGGLDLMRSVKARFDPAGILAPGRFVGGI